MTETFNCLIMGAAGRDFHNFQTFFRDRPSFRVCAFTAAQIPYIESRAFPRSLAGPNYTADIPIYSERQLPDLIARFEIQFVFLADTGKRVAVLRHPMPYGHLERQAVQRFATHEDLDRFACTIEEREEYEPYIELRLVVFAGVDYKAILALAEAEADIILWDGGNNDFSFVRPTVSIVVVDALRPGHEVGYYPGETNLRSADIVVINKVGNASPETLSGIRARIHANNLTTEVVEADLEILVDEPEVISGKRVVVF